MEIATDCVASNALALRCVRGAEGVALEVGAVEIVAGVDGGVDVGAEAHGGLHSRRDGRCLVADQDEIGVAIRKPPIL